jgi:predicted DNA-binding protein (UPF0251 family)
MLRQGRSLDDIVTKLRALGLSKMECMTALEDYGELAHREAKLAVHESTAWRDLREAAEKLEADALSELEKRGRRKPDGSLEL